MATNVNKIRHTCIYINAIVVRIQLVNEYVGYLL